MRPDLAKFRQLGNIFKLYLVFGKISNTLGHNFRAFGQIFIFDNGPIIEKQSGHTVNNQKINSTLT